MKNKELIEILQTLPLDANVGILYDGANRLDAGCSYLSRNGEVVIGGDESVVYYDEDRPIYAPTEKEDAYWNTKNLNK